MKDLSPIFTYRLRTRLDEPQPERDVELRGRIHEVALAWPQYGYRRITAGLRRRGVAAGRKRVLRLMREDNLLCLRKRRYAITTDSAHDLPVYPNLAATLAVADPEPAGAGPAFSPPLSPPSMSDDGLPERAPAALVLIDVIQPFDFDGADDLLEHARPAAERIAALKKRAKAAGLPVIYANDHFGGWREDFSELVEHCLEADCPGRDIVERLRPDADDYYVLKPKLSAFFAAPLEALLRNLGADTVILAGFAGDICVHATALDGHMRGFDLVIPSDGTASQSPHENARVLAYARRVFEADVRPVEALDLDALAEAD